VARLNTIFASWLDMLHGTELVAEFVQLACHGQVASGANRSPGESVRDRFYRLALEHALVYLGSRLLYPARQPVRESDYYALYSQPRELIVGRSLYTRREYLEMIDFLLLHKDYETHRGKYLHPPQLIERAMQFSTSRVEFLVRELGLMLGTELYDAYVSGRLSKRSLRTLFFRDLRRRGLAYGLYFSLSRKIAKPRPLLVA
jgi:hypothetical protein